MKVIYDKYKVDRNGVVYGQSGKPLRPAIDKKGYLRVGLVINGKLTTKKVHRLVCEAFIPNPEQKPFVNHKDLDKQNNSAYNLEWSTPKENTKHAIEMGVFSFQTSEKSVNINPKKGSLNGWSKLTENQVKEIRLKYKPRVYTREMLAKEYGVKVSCIKDIVNRKSWRHI